MTKTIATVEGMSCGMCEAHVNDAVRRSFDVKSVKSSYKKNQTEIIAESPIDEEKLGEALGEIGYTLTGVRYEEYVKKGLFR